MTEQDKQVTDLLLAGGLGSFTAALVAKHKKAVEFISNLFGGLFISVFIGPWIVKSIPGGVSYEAGCGIVWITGFFGMLVLTIGYNTVKRSLPKRLEHMAQGVGEAVEKRVTGVFGGAEQDKEDGKDSEEEEDA